MAKPLIPEPKVFAMPGGDPRDRLGEYDRYFGPDDADLVRGEKSTQYLAMEHAPDAVTRALPGVRMLFVVREPVARAYSNWAWSTHNGHETLPFAEAIDREGQREDPFPEQPWVRPFDYLARSRYAGFARRWHAALGRQSVRFLVFEDLVAGGDALGEAQEFVGVEPAAIGPLPEGLANETHGVSPPLDPATAHRLRELMAPEVEDFASVTGVDVGRWGYG